MIAILCACGALADVPPVPLRCVCGVAFAGDTPRVEVDMSGAAFETRFTWRGTWTPDERAAAEFALAG